MASRDRRRVAIYDVGLDAAVRRSNWYSGGESGELLFRDVDGDAAPDVVVAQGPLNRMQILAPLGGGFFGLPASFP